MIKLGMIGAGRIAGRFVREVTAVEGISISVVCARHKNSAQSFARQWLIPHYTDNVEELIGCVDAVYIAVPHELHFQYAKKMLERGIHVLCEKPMVLQEAQARELFSLARKHNVVLMEGIKTAYCPGFTALIEMAKSGIIGQIREVEACLTKLTPTNMRELTDEKYGGSFAELGTYALLPAIKLLGMECNDITFRFQKMNNGLDAYAKAELSYNGAWGVAKTGLLVKSEGQLVIAGTQGYILAKSPWWLTREFEVCFEDTTRNQTYYYEYAGAGLRYEIEAFVQEIQGKVTSCITPEESIYIAGLMEKSLKARDVKTIQEDEKNEPMKVWAHRGMSFLYPENTLEAFEEAANLEGLAGIELDVQMTRDGELVVIHDETVDRTTDGTGFVKDFDLKDIRKLKISKQNGEYTAIPTLREVLEVLKPFCSRKNLQVNIELKNGKIRYEGMEQKVLNLVSEQNLEAFVWYSSFLPESMGMIKMLNPDAKTGILAASLEDCIRHAVAHRADALHPYIGGLNIEIPENLKRMPVRAWNIEELLYGQDGWFRETDLTRYRRFGVTDVFTNVAERYLR